LPITKDGAPAMTSENAGLIGLCKPDPAFPGSVIHHQSLYTKAIDFQHVMSVVQKIVNSIRARPVQQWTLKHFWTNL
jgi:hypothetical protein